MKKEKSSELELGTEEKIELVFEKAKELCRLVGAIHFDMSITIDSENFYISQRYDKDVSFANERDNSNNDSNN